MLKPKYYLEEEKRKRLWRDARKSLAGRCVISHLWRNQSWRRRLAAAA